MIDIEVLNAFVSVEGGGFRGYFVDFLIFKLSGIDRE